MCPCSYRPKDYITQCCAVEGHEGCGVPWSVYGSVIICLTLITDKQRPGHLPITLTQNEHTALSLSPNIPLILYLQSLPVNLKCRFIVYTQYFFGVCLRIGYSETVIPTSANRNLDHTVVSGLSVELNRLALHQQFMAFLKHLRLVSIG